MIETTTIRHALLARAEEAARLYEHPFSLPAVMAAASLASAHNHQWGAMADAIAEGDIAAPTLTAEDIWQWVQTHTTPGPCGWGIAYPDVQGPKHLASICHETATGRTRWSISDNPYRPDIVQIYITIRRPDDAGRIEFSLLSGWDRCAMAQTRVVTCETFGDLEERHFAALWRCIGPLGLNLDANSLAPLPESVRTALEALGGKEGEDV